ncbi:MAG: hypothetical protein EOP04_27900 [Proteobacteria bacterium]|nr:MAG: hypothetical protein EOP04_27900 [Pseudomonadota bacterium]
MADPKKGSGKKRPLKFKIRPSTADFRAGAARLDAINAMAPKRRVPVVINLSDSDETDTSEKLYHATNRNYLQEQLHHEGQGATNRRLAAPSSSNGDSPPSKARNRQRPIITDSDEGGT